MITHAFMMPHPPIAVPEIGEGEEKKIQPTLDAYQEVAEAIAEIKPEIIILTSPHATMYRDWFTVSAGHEASGSFSRYGHPEVAFHEKYDYKFAEALSRECRREEIQAGTAYEGDPALDQGTMVPLYFIHQACSDFKLVRIGLSGFSLPEHYRLGMAIQKVVDELGTNAVFVASGDLSHCQKNSGSYEFHPEGPVYDEKIMHTMGSGNFRELLEYDPVFLEKAMECGHRSFTIMAGALDGKAVRATTLSHEATFGVGYGFVAYEVVGEDPSRHFLQQYEENERTKIASHKEDPYVSLARSAVTEWVQHHRKLPVPDDLPAELKTDRAGAFVSLHEFGGLRGCIGTTEPTRNSLAEEIIGNGISASSRDPRFDAVRPEELPYLQISVDVLNEPEPIPDGSYLDVKKYGVICRTPDGRCGLLLPNLDGVDSVEQQISIACRKGDISPYEEDLHLERFEVVRHE